MAQQACCTHEVGHLVRNLWPKLAGKQRAAGRQIIAKGLHIGTADGGIEGAHMGHLSICKPACRSFLHQNGLLLQVPTAQRFATQYCMAPVASQPSLSRDARVICSACMGKCAYHIAAVSRQLSVSGVRSPMSLHQTRMLRAMQGFRGLTLTHQLLLSARATWCVAVNPIQWK